MHSAGTPSIDLEGFRRLLFVYDGEDDIAYLHLDGPRAAITEQADDGWYLRILDGSVVGLEIHGLKRLLLSTPFYSSVFAPAIDELEGYTGMSFDGDSIRADAPIGELPKTTHLAILLIGQAIEKYESARMAEYEDAGKRLLTA
jgi:uncharacterized protein YuzE